MKHRLLKLMTWGKQHKQKSMLILVIVMTAIILILKFLSTDAAETRYVLTAVKKGALITSISGSGQISATDQVNVNAKTSGEVLSVSVKAGQEVKKGTILARIDATDALKAVRDAEINLQNAQLSLQKLQKPADALSMLQSENALTNAFQSKEKAESDLQKTYDDAFTSISNTFLQLPAVMTGLENIINGTSYASTQKNLPYYGDLGRIWDIPGTYVSQEAVDASYKTARRMYDQAMADYKATSRISDVGRIEAVLNQTYAMTKAVSDCAKNTQDFLAFIKDLQTKHNADIPVMLASHQTSAASYLGTANAQLSPLLSNKTAIKNGKQSIDNAIQTIAERTASLDKLKEGPDDLDVSSSKLSLEQREQNLRDARKKLWDCTIRAPFDGTVAKLNIKKGDTVSSGAAIAVFITPQRTATISLNEVDVTDISAGQKATLAFDAVSGLTMTGEVSEVDTIGTASQGVVTYNVKILFDTQDARIKPGMSVTALVVTSAKADVLLVPNSAVKTRGAARYVEQIDNEAATGPQGIVSQTPPARKMVGVGISNDEQTEIISGLVEGEIVVSRTIAQTEAAAAPSPSSPFFGSSTGGARNASSGNVMRITR